MHRSASLGLVIAGNEMALTSNRKMGATGQQMQVLVECDDRRHTATQDIHLARPCSAHVGGASPRD